ncbi:MAG: DUF1566 domain-containing protein [Desulfuromonadaceae bacterium]|nr:DUF1566 domain-containing protein [Desulfuromonadaceae bacterium]
MKIKPTTKMNPIRLVVLAFCVLSAAIFVLSGCHSRKANKELEWEQRPSSFWNFVNEDRRFWLKDGVQYCRQLELDGKYDWRLPTKDELHDFAAEAGVLRSYSTTPTRGIYWSATPYGEKKSRYWAVSLYNGEAAPLEIHNYNAVLCVRDRH